MRGRGILVLIFYVFGSVFIFGQIDDEKILNAGSMAEIVEYNDKYVLDNLSGSNDSLRNAFYFESVSNAFKKHRFRLCDSLTNYYLPIFKEEKDTFHFIKTLIRRSYSYNRLGMYEREIEIALRANALARIYGDKKLIAQTVTVLAWISYYIGNFDRALELSRELKPLAQSGYSSLGAYNNLVGNIYKNTGKYEKGIEYLSNAINHAKLKSSLSREALYKSNRAQIYINLGQIEKALDDIEFAVKYNLENEEWHQYCGNATILANCRLHEGRLEDALHLVQNALETSKKIESYRGLRSCYRMLFEIHKAMGSYEASLKALDTLHHIYNDYHVSKKFDDVLVQVYQTELKLQEQALELVKNKSELGELKLEQAKKSTRNALYFGAAALALLIAYFQRKQQLRKYKDERIRQKYKNELLELEMRALRSQMNPHFIFNSLNSIKNFIIANEKKVATSYLNNFAKLMRLILLHSKEKSISIKEELHALELYVDMEKVRFPDKFEVKINLDSNVDKDFAVPPLVLQPFVENAIRHAFEGVEERGAIEVNVVRKENSVVCTIDDNGIGRKKSLLMKTEISTHRSLGIDITRKRLEALHGRIGEESIEIIDKYEDGKPRGTRVRITFPLLER